MATLKKSGSRKLLADGPCGTSGHDYANGPPTTLGLNISDSQAESSFFVRLKRGEAVMTMVEWGRYLTGEHRNAGTVDRRSATEVLRDVAQSISDGKF